LLSRSVVLASLLTLLCVTPAALGESTTAAVRLDKMSSDEYSQVKNTKGVVLLAVNWNRKWNCGGFENAQVRKIAFDRMPVTKPSDDAAADVVLDDVPLIFTTPGFDDYAFVVEPGEYALSEFTIKVARSIRDVGGFNAKRSFLIKDGKALGGSFEVQAGEIVYIGHFFLDCLRQPIPWRYYPDGQDAFKEYLTKIKSKYPDLDVDKAQFRLFQTTQFGNDYKLP